MAGDGCADLGWGFAQPGLLVGVEAFLGAGGALGAVESLEAAAQAGVAESAVATAVAGKLVGHAGNFGHLLVDVDLPWVTEVFACKLAAGEDGWQGADFEWSRGVIGRNVVGRDWTTGRSWLR